MIAAWTNWTGRILIGALLALAVPVQAQDGFDGEVSVRAVSAKRGNFAGDDFDSSGVGAQAEIGFEAGGDGANFRAEASALHFEYSDDARGSRTSFGGSLNVTQDLSETIEFSLTGAYAEDLVLLESLEGDQARVRGQLQWQQGNDRVRFYAEYRDRDYASTVPSSGHGMAYRAEYNRRLGSYHWLRFSARYDEIDSADPLRGYERVTGAVDYSHPVGSGFRLRAGAEARRWTYDDRIAQGDPQGDRRRDKFVSPMIGMDYGSARGGVFARARASYQFRTSNDERFTGDTPRVDVTVGYRF